MNYALYSVNILAIIILFILQRKFINFNIRMLIAFAMGTILAYIATITIDIKLIYAFYQSFINVYSSLLYLITLLILPITIIASALTIKSYNSIKGFKSLFIISLLLALLVAFLTAYLANLAEYTLTNLILTKNQSLFNISSYNTFIIIVFSLIFASAYLGIIKKQPEFEEKFDSVLNFINTLINRIYIVILRMLPYAVLFISYGLYLNNGLGAFFSLLATILYAYVLFIIILALHTILLGVLGINVIKYFKNSFKIIFTAFKTSSSHVTIDANTALQNKIYNIKPTLANASAQLSAIFAQHGCAIIYPTLILIGIAYAFNLYTSSLIILMFIPIVATFVSVIVAGFGGGAKIALLILFIFFNIPLEIFVILMVIDPIIDFGRTAVNINGNIVSSLINLKINSKAVKQHES